MNGVCIDRSITSMKALMDKLLVRRYFHALMEFQSEMEDEPIYEEFIARFEGG